MGRPLVASTIDLSVPIAQQKPTSSSASLNRPVQFTKEHLKDEDFLPRQLTNMQQEIARTTLAQRSHPEQAPVTFKNVVCPAGGKVVLAHNFGRYADYIVVKWKSAPLPAVATATGHSLVCDEEEALTTRRTTEDVLCLNSNVAGVANIRVFPGG